MSTIRNGLECAAIGGKAGGLRTAALVLRGVVDRGLDISLLALAKEFEDAAAHLDAEALKLIPLEAEQ